MKLACVIAGLAMLCSLATAQASPVDVTFTATGSAGNWTLDFSVTNNLGGTNDIYYFGVVLPDRDIAGSPALWDPNAHPSWNWGGYGGSNTEYNNIWITCPTASCIPGFPGNVVAPGGTLSSFQTFDTDLTLPSSVGWFAVASGGQYTGTGCSFICGGPPTNTTNPGFEGFAVQAIATAPLPGAVWLFASALGLLGAIRRWRVQLPDPAPLGDRLIA